MREAEAWEPGHAGETHHACTPGQGLRMIKLGYRFFRRVSPAGIEPVGFRVKSDLRNHCAIVQPRKVPHRLPSDRLPAEVDSLPLWRGLVSS